MTKDRLFGWHAALFPTGRSGMYKITVGDWRRDQQGPMQVVSGPIGKEKVHYTAPEAPRLEKEMTQFLNWFNKDDHMEPVIKSAIAHLWFVSIHSKTGMVELPGSLPIAKWLERIEAIKDFIACLRKS